MSVKVEIYQVTLLCRCAALIVEVLERTKDANLNFVLLSSTVLLKNSFVFFFQIMEGAAGLSSPPLNSPLDLNDPRGEQTLESVRALLLWYKGLFFEGRGMSHTL